MQNYSILPYFEFYSTYNRLKCVNNNVLELHVISVRNLFIFAREVRSLRCHGRVNFCFLPKEIFDGTQLQLVVAYKLSI
jgi:hypothetical protein